jgi:hypothetical protein
MQQQRGQPACRHHRSDAGIINGKMRKSSVSKWQRHLRSLRTRIPWDGFAEASVEGISMAWLLVLDATATNLKTGQLANEIVFRQAALRDAPGDVAQWLNWLARNPAARNKLPSWPIAPRQIQPPRMARGKHHVR